MKTVEQIEQMLNKMGIETYHEVEDGKRDSDFHFNYNERTIWFFDNNDPDYLEFAILHVFDVTDENRADLLEICNRFNYEYKYIKVAMDDTSVHLSFDQVKVPNLTPELLEQYLDNLTLGWQVLGDMILGNDTDEEEE